MRPPPRLSGCYTPTAVSTTSPPLHTSAPLHRRKEQILNSGRSGVIKGDEKASVETDGHRPDESRRSSHALRRLLLESDVIGSSSGSALVELGHTKVLCTVLGPVTASCPAVPSSLIPLSLEQGTLHVEVKYIPTTGYPEDQIELVRSIESQSASQSKGSTATTTSTVPNQQTNKQLHSFVQSRESDLSARLATALAAAVPLQPYPKCAVLLHVTVLVDDGSVLAASVTAATLALINAGIELYDVVAACTVAIVSTNNVMNDKVESSAGAAASASLTPNTILLADPTLEEMSIADSVITIGIMPNWKEVTLWEQWSGGGGDSGGDDVDTSNTSILGAVSLETTNEAVNLCRAGCRTMHKFLREHLIGACSNDGS